MRERDFKERKKWEFTLLLISVVIVFSFIYINQVSSLAVSSNTTTESIEHMWIGDTSIYEVTYSSHDKLVYLGGNSGVFGVYNRTSNSTEDLRGVDIGDWIGTTRLDDVTYDSNDKLIYFGGLSGLFGVYNRTSNTTENLNTTDSGNWIGTTVIYDLIYDSNDKLIYFVGDSGVFGLYNRTSNSTENLNSTDPGNWIGTTSLQSVTYDSNNKLIYLAGASGIFGAYNRTSNTTTVATATTATTTSSSPSGGGIVLGQPTQTNSWDVINPDQPAEMIITNPGIDLTKIIIQTTETVTGGSVTVTKIDILAQSDLEIGLLGEVYQTFKIDTINLTDNNIANATIEFRVNKTWIEQQGGGIENISLYRKEDSANKWNTLNTTYLSEDSNYYYFLAISPGFSSFTIALKLAGIIECVPEEKRCVGNNLEQCNIEGTAWETVETCEYECKRKKCISEIELSTVLFYMLIVVLSGSILFVIFKGYKYFSKRRVQKGLGESKKTLHG